MKRMSTVLLAGVLTAGSVGAQMISSNPNFKREGANPYTCTTPKGKKVSCNQWLGMGKSGWKTQCVKPGKSMLSKLKNGVGKSIWLDAPETGCAALFDEAWADTRKWEAKNQAKEYRRTLKEGHFNQHVEVKEAGTYELGACMVRDVVEWAGFATFDAYTNTGGIMTMLMQWHPVDTVTVHAVLPNNKTRWGPQDNPLANIPNRVSDWNDAPATAPPGTEIGHEQDGQVMVYYGSGSHAIWFDPFQTWGEFLDGFEGHAGIGSKYQERGFPGAPGINAYWTCYSESLHLDPGFYVIRTEIKPFLHNIAPVYDANDVIVGGEYVSDYTGYGAVSNVHLTRQPGLAGQ